MYIYGVRSNIPFSLRHYLLVDIDTKTTEKTREFLKHHQIQIDYEEETPNGFHFVCLLSFTFEELIYFMPIIPNVDLSWFRIGVQRGYWFLWTRRPLFCSKEVRFMRLNVKGKGSEWLRRKTMRPPKNSMII